MPMYLVTYHVEVEADNPDEAAFEGFEFMQHAEGGALIVSAEDGPEEWVIEVIAGDTPERTD